MEGIPLLLTTLLLASRAGPGAPAPQGIDPGRIYTPDDLNELRAAIAYEECLRGLGCDPGPEEASRCLSGDSSTSTSVRVGVRTGADCNPVAGQVLWPATGQCVQLLDQGPCPQGQWVRLSDATPPAPECAPRPCREGEALAEGRRCRDLRDASACPGRQRLVTNEFGMAECDCAPGTVYHQPTATCFAPYSRGPCRPGHVIKVIDSGASGRAECVENPCPRAGMVPLDGECHVSTRLGPGTRCHALETQGPCVSGFLTVDEGLSEPVCLETHSIFNIPNSKLCSRGSMRDLAGRCRRNLALDLAKGPRRPPPPLPPLVTSRPGIRPDGGLCPPGQVLMAGICLRLALS